LGAKRFCGLFLDFDHSHNLGVLLTALGFNGESLLDSEALAQPSLKVWIKALLVL
jgi:hypothetical protein